MGSLDWSGVDITKIETATHKGYHIVCPGCRADHRGMAPKAADRPTKVRCDCGTTTEVDWGLR